MFEMRKKFFFYLGVSLYLLSSCINAGELDKGIALYNQHKFIQAITIIENEARHGNSEAQYYLGRMYEFGEGKKRNLKKSFYWYSRGAKQGNRKAQNNLASLYADGEGVKKNQKKAIELYTLSAEQGTAAAQFNLGMMYREGEGTERDYVRAVNLFRQAASQDHTGAIYALGLAYQLGMGVPVDLNEAVKWYKKAAEKGDTSSMWNLSTIYLPEDDPSDASRWDEVYKWYALGMEHGDRKNAPFGMGLIYLFGRGHYPIDNQKAAELFTLSAENGKVDSWYWLGVMEEYGFGRPYNTEKAFELYRKAAALGSGPAIRRLNMKEPDPTVKLFHFVKDLFEPQ